ncbi:hypothetical protein [Gilvimarinus chinensis]|uniref:hypothetical protein n=1 Tax=Gilvimarinus chinensis TaxID=396005 RepID=UPI0003726F33|nr:hypothetical protein [Gilvimarinus chinensis]
MKVPDSVVPLLQKVTSQRACEIEFWRYLKEEDFLDSLFQLSDELMLSEIEESSLPEGYFLVAYIFNWETNCQFSDWYAIENKRDEMEKIILCYREVGLYSEAAALTKAVKAWEVSQRDEAAVSLAYKSVSNKYSDEDVRFEYLADFFSRYSDSCFYEHSC